jgi:hypothetical protein
VRECPTRGRKLNSQQVEKIRDRVQAGEPLKVIAGDFDVTYHTVFDIVSGRTWGKRRQLVKGRLRKIDAAERDRLYLMKRRLKLSDAQLSKRMDGVSRATVNKAMREAQLVLAFKVRRSYLATGDRNEICQNFSLHSDELDRLLVLVSERKLPKRLLAECKS